MKWTGRLILLAGMVSLASIPCSAVNANEGEYVKIDKAAEPEKIPRFMTLTPFFEGYQYAIRPRLLAEISSSDDAILMNASSSFEAFRSAENERHRKEIQTLCSRAGSLEPRTYMRLREEAAVRSNSRLTEHYENVLARISAGGRRAVETFVDTEITPHLATSLPRDAYWESYNDETLREQFELDCYLAANGAYPPEIEREMERASEAAMQEAMRQLPSQRPVDGPR